MSIKKGNKMWQLGESSNGGPSTGIVPCIHLHPSSRVGVHAGAAACERRLFQHDVMGQRPSGCFLSNRMVSIRRMVVPRRDSLSTDLFRGSRFLQTDSKRWQQSERARIVRMKTGIRAFSRLNGCRFTRQTSNRIRVVATGLQALDESMNHVTRGGRREDQPV